MANDRVIIKCKTCGAWKMLLKHFPGSLDTRNCGLMEWLDSHGGCHPKLWAGDLGGDPGFELLTENSKEADELAVDGNSALRGWNDNTA